MAADQHVVGPTAFVQEYADLPAIVIDFLAAAAVNHGELVVGPARQVPWASVAVADEGQDADDAAIAVDKLVVDVPHGHAVVSVAQTIVIGYGGDPADDAGVLQAADQGEGFRRGQLQLFRQPLPGFADQRQAGLCQRDQAAGEQLVRGGNADRHDR
ncbi:hypothetical protein D3C84_906470 [compost metagenome]